MIAGAIFLISVINNDSAFFIPMTSDQVRTGLHVNLGQHSCACCDRKYDADQDSEYYQEAEI